MYVSTSQSIVCEWHQFQGLNVVIYSQYRQNFRACGGRGGNLITPSRTRPPVGAQLVVPTHWPPPAAGAGGSVLSYETDRGMLPVYGGLYGGLFSCRLRRAGAKPG